MSRPAIFLTGGSGLLGHALTRSLLARGFDVHLLVRGARHLSARERIDRLMLEVSPSRQAWLEDRKRIHVIEGDLCAERYGLDQRHWNDLRRSIMGVVHCAALLNFLPEQRDDVMRVNLEGARRAHDLAHEAGLQTLHLVSTAYVVGQVGEPGTRPTQACLELPCEGERRFNNPYEESKLEAERLIAALDQSRGMKSTLHRPSCIVGEYETGRTITFRTLYGFIDLIDQERLRLQRQGLADLRDKKLIYFSDIPRDATRNIVPVDYVSEAIAHIVAHPTLHGRIYHLTNPAPPNRWETNRWMTRAAGFGDLLMPSEAAQQDPQVLVRFQPGRLARFEKVFSGYLEDHEPIFDDSNTRAALERTSIHLPPVDAAYLTRVVRYVLETRWRNDVERSMAERYAREAA